MFTGPSYQAVSKNGDLCVYSDSNRTLVRTYPGQANNREIIDSLYSQGLAGADRAARNTRSMKIYRNKKNRKYYQAEPAGEGYFRVTCLLGGANGEPYGPGQPRTAEELQRLYIEVPPTTQ